VRHLPAALHYPELIQTIDSVAIQSAAQQYLSPDAYGVLTVIPK